MIGLIALYVAPRLLGIIILLGSIELIAWASYSLGIWPVGALLRVLEWVVIIGTVIWMWNYSMTVLRAHKAILEMKIGPARRDAASDPLSEAQLAGRKDEAMLLIRHLQKMLAYQQLSMERYNDAAAMASGIPRGSGMEVQRPLFSVQNRSLITQHMIPALVYKIDLIRSIKEQHEQIAQLVAEENRQPLEEMSAAIDIMLERANLQYNGFSALEQNSDVDVDMTSLDQAEVAAVTSAVQGLNSLIEKVGLTVPASKEWIRINHQVFNEVRAGAGLLPIEEERFGGMYLQGLSGIPVRFFDELSRKEVREAPNPSPGGGGPDRSDSDQESPVASQLEETLITMWAELALTSFRRHWGISRELFMALAHEYGELEVGFEPPRERMTEAEIFVLFKGISDSDRLDLESKAVADFGLLAVLEGSVPSEEALSLLKLVLGDEFVAAVMEK